jgi:hypothetical protein
VYTGAQDPANAYGNRLEHITQSFVRSSPAPTPAIYQSTGYSAGLYLTNKPDRHEVIQEGFLIPGRPMTQFVGASADVQEHINKTFTKITGRPFPQNIQVTICSKENLRKFHNGSWSDGILGFSLNRQGQGMNEIFVKENNLDVLMLTIGHEIGHVMSKSLPNAHDEEAKAFAFELAWVDTMIEHNIAGLADCFHPAPAKNGLHDVAFAFVQHLLTSGKKAIDIFSDLVWGRESITQQLEMIVLR